MGTLFYGGSDTPIGIEDRALAHLKVVIATKLRRNESFTLSWQHPPDQERGRSTLWLHPSISLRFTFDEPATIELSRQWIEDLAQSANSSGGISLVAEHIEAGIPDASPDDSTVVSLGKVEVEDLSVDKLTLAGVELSTATAEKDHAIS